MAPSNVGAMWRVQARRADSPLNSKALHHQQERVTATTTTTPTTPAFGDHPQNACRVESPAESSGAPRDSYAERLRRTPTNPDSAVVTRQEASVKTKYGRGGGRGDNPFAWLLRFVTSFVQQKNGSRKRTTTDRPVGIRPADTTVSPGSSSRCDQHDQQQQQQQQRERQQQQPAGAAGNAVGAADYHLMNAYKSPIIPSASEPVPIGGNQVGWQAKGAAEPEDQGGGEDREREEDEENCGGGGREWRDGEIQYAKLRGCQSKRGSFTEEQFVPCYATFTPNMSHESLQDMPYRAPETRVPSAVAPPSSVARPNYHDALRRVAVVVYQHIKTCEWKRKEAEEREKARGVPPPSLRQRAASGDVLRSMTRNSSALWGDAEEGVRGGSESGREQTGQKRSVNREPFNAHKAEMFHEKQFLSPQYRYKFVQAPVMALPGTVFTLREVKIVPKAPTVDEIHDFIKTLFSKACLSSECSLVCLIYVERLMETAQVPLLAGTWKPILLCGLLLASKVWQDLSSWNVEFSTVYPEYSLKSINRLELLFLGQMKWDMSISSSLYAKYYFALRSLAEKKDFRRRYNQVMKIDAPQASRVQERSDSVTRSVTSAAMLSKSL